MVAVRLAALVLIVYGSLCSTVRGQSSLHTPTQFYKLSENIHIIVDCWNDRLLYTTSFSVDNDACGFRQVPTVTPLRRPHSVASNGDIMMFESTETNQVVIMKYSYNTVTHDASFQEIQAIDIGKQPHYTAYHGDLKKFFVYASFSHSVHILEWDEASQQVVPFDTMHFSSKLGYMRSFLISGDKFYFGPSQRMPYFLEWTISSSAGKLELTDYRTIPFSAERFQREQVYYYDTNHMLVVNKTLWVSYYADYGDTGPFFDSFEIAQVSEYSDSNVPIFINQTAAYLSPQVSPRVLRVTDAGSHKVFTAYYMTHFDGRVFMGLIHRRSGIYSWPDNGNPEESGRCHFC